MKNDILDSLTRLPDAELVARVKDLVSRERETIAELIAHLGELDTRDFHLREGYPSLYVYCRDALGLSEWEAYNRIDVARTARRFPVILGMLAEGSVNLTTVKLLAPHLTPENHVDVLASARGKRKPQVEEIVARLSPRPDAPATVRRLPARRSESPAMPLEDLELAGSGEPHGSPSGKTHGSTSGDSHGSSGDTVDSADVPAAPLPPPVADASLAIGAPAPVPAMASAPAAAAVKALSPDRYKLQLTISGETLEKMRLAKDMLGHALPAGDDAAVLDRAFTALLAELAKKEFAETSRPGRPRPRKPGARNPSAAVKRAVWVRDLGRCVYVGPNGHRCGERRFVEFHHVDPYALGGEATVDGIQLRCRRHNDYEGRLYFGKRSPRDETGAASKPARKRYRSGHGSGADTGPCANLFQNKFA